MVEGGTVPQGAPWQPVFLTLQMKLRSNRNDFAIRTDPRASTIWWSSHWSEICAERKVWRQIWTAWIRMVSWCSKHQRRLQGTKYGDVLRLPFENSFMIDITSEWNHLCTTCFCSVDSVGEPWKCTADALAGNSTSHFVSFCYILSMMFLFHLCAFYSLSWTYLSDNVSLGTAPRSGVLFLLKLPQQERWII